MPRTKSRIYPNNVYDGNSMIDVWRMRVDEWDEFIKEVPVYPRCIVYELGYYYITRIDDTIYKFHKTEKMIFHRKRNQEGWACLIDDPQKHFPAFFIEQIL